MSTWRGKADARLSDRVFADFPTFAWLHNNHFIYIAWTRPGRTSAYRRRMKVLRTEHAERRLLEWSLKRSITRERVEEAVLSPEQVVPGHAGLYVAQSRIDRGLLRVPFFEVEDDRKIVTVYWTSRVNRYWET